MSLQPARRSQGDEMLRTLRWHWMVNVLKIAIVNDTGKPQTVYTGLYTLTVQPGERVPLGHGGDDAPAGY